MNMESPKLGEVNQTHKYCESLHTWNLTKLNSQCREQNEAYQNFEEGGMEFMKGYIVADKLVIDKGSNSGPLCILDNFSTMEIHLHTF